MGAKYVGAEVRRREDPRLLIGRGRYVDDLRPFGCLHAAILRSPHAHARIRRIGIDRARAPPRRRRLLHVRGPGAAAPAAPASPALRRRRSRPASASDLKTAAQLAAGHERVRYVGEPVAVIVAADPYAAEDALELIEVDYEPLPAVVDVEAGLTPGAPLLHQEWGDNVGVAFKVRIGDPERALADAPVARGRPDPRAPLRGDADRAAGHSRRARRARRRPHRLGLDPGAALAPAHALRDARPPGAQAARRRARGRRRLRDEGLDLPGGRPDPRDRGPARPPREVDRDPARAPPERDPLAGAASRRRARREPRRPHRGVPGPLPAGPGRVQPLGHRPAVQHRRPHPGPAPDPQRGVRGARRGDQQDAPRAVPRGRAARGRLRHGPAARHAGPRDGARSGASFAGGTSSGRTRCPTTSGCCTATGTRSCTTAATSPTALARALEAADYHGRARRAGGAPDARGSIGAWASPRTSRAPGSGRTRARPCGSTPRARCWSRPARARRGRATRRSTRRSPRTRSASASRTSR